MDGVFQHGTPEPRQTDAQPAVLFCRFKTDVKCQHGNKK